MQPLEQLINWIKESNKIVFFGGAGVSTESGIPDFRSADGLYHQRFQYPPEQIISHSFFSKNPECEYAGEMNCFKYIAREVEIDA